MKRPYSFLLPLFALLVVLAGCATPPRVAQIQRQVAAAASAAQSAAAAAATETSTTSSSTTAVSTASATRTPQQVAARTTTASTSAATGAATTGTVSTATPAPAVVQAIKAVIQKANDEQQSAFSKQDPTLMQDTATTAYYQKLVQTNRDLENGGVASIKLLQLQWGPVTQTGTTSAQATTIETWRTVMSDGTVDQTPDRNVYTLVQQNGAWKIQADVHPDTNLDNPGGSPAGQPGTGPAPSTRPTPLTVGQSHNWSGYAAMGGAYTAVSGTWKVPTVAATSPGSDATWIGIGGVTSHDLIQAGTQAVVQNSGGAQYQAWVELLPQSSHPVPLAVSPGDSVSVSLTQQSAGNWLVAFKDNTTGKSYQTTEQYNSSLSSAEWVEEAPSGGRRVLPLDQFGTVQFSAGSTVKNGSKDTIAQAGAKEITMIDRYGQAVATPSALTANGAGFSVTRQADTTPVQPVPGTSPFGRLPGTGGYGQGGSSGFGQGGSGGFGQGVGGVLPAA